MSGLFLLFACACSDDGFDAGGSDGGQADVGGPCKDGEKRCFTLSLRECKGGKWVEQARCTSAQICTDDLGCVDCIPSASTACQGNDVHKCNADGSFGDLVEQCLTEACKNGKCGSDKCSAGSQLIYVVDNAYNLLSFNPKNDAHTFEQIGKIQCPAGAPWPGWSGGSTPFSMSVDRKATAWVLYTSGEIFWVDTKTAACTPSGYVKGTNGFELFGMGFVSDAPGSSAEKLYIFGGAAGALDKGSLARVDPQTKSITNIGKLALKDQSPELTGTGNAKLFGFFPGSQAFVAEIDKATGTFSRTWQLSLGSGQVSAWAFAHWGGRFYLFVTTVSGLLGEIQDSQVLRLDPKTGKVDPIANKLPYVIVGAGVSTCAPTID